MFNFAKIARPRTPKDSVDISLGDLALADQLSALCRSRDGRLQHRAVRSALHEMNRAAKECPAGRALLAHYALGASRVILGASWSIGLNTWSVGFGGKGFEILQVDSIVRDSDWPDLLSIESPKARRRALVKWSRSWLPVLLEIKLDQFRDAKDAPSSTDRLGESEKSSPDKLGEITNEIAALHRRFGSEVRLALPGMNRNLRSSRVGQAVMELTSRHKQILRFSYRWSLGGEHFGLAFTGRRGFVIQRVRPEDRWPVKDFKDYAEQRQRDIESWAARWIVERAAHLLSSARAKGDK